ncbi:MAG: helix-turn-helix transcriptional regulator [bacterium]|nr:helix-turn-helix transcriptional regulator [bacterium]
MVNNRAGSSPAPGTKFWRDWPTRRPAGVADNTIIKIEAGKNQNPMFDTLKKIVKALGVSIKDLIK